ncbi:type II toxin-antitoxin system RelE/ParE family toxin [Roseomonas sp. SSH11]|uniref:Type II toxin-antitoxin system RelE/ParE family toxin n=1 Tax=Pararoseomonas baculiformis TaxID=2820812 RepID=A0ABS4ALE0_9PROT|nr:type II toxin-antitoxin system RelE/ParE family toxin [Pararoseomonas baculiformis]MBP0447831.1 type II toxin-antitoxin system RelE/ParE family toxin [Pararoseomonas baculiformis]
MAHRVVLAPQRALAYVEDLLQHLLGFAEFPERGARRDAIHQGLRIVGYRRHVMVAFHVNDTTMTIPRVLFGGHDVEGLLGKGGDGGGLTVSSNGQDRALLSEAALTSLFRSQSGNRVQGIEKSLLLQKTEKAS